MTLKVVFTVLAGPFDIVPLIVGHRLGHPELIPVVTLSSLGWQPSLVGKLSPLLIQSPRHRE